MIPEKLLRLEKLTPERLAGITLDPGPHKTRAEGVCATEAAAWLAGEKHSATPECVSFAIVRFLSIWNDDLQQQDRDRLLKPLLPRILGTGPGNGDSGGGRYETAETARCMMAEDWLLRINAPTWLDAGGFARETQTLRAMPRTRPGMTEEEREKVRTVLEAAYSSTRETKPGNVPDLLPCLADQMLVNSSGTGAAMLCNYKKRLSGRVIDTAANAARRAIDQSVDPTPVTRELQEDALRLLERMISPTETE